MQFKRAGQKLSCEQALARLEEQYQELIGGIERVVDFPSTVA